MAIVAWLAGRGGWESIARSLIGLHAGWFLASLLLLVAGQSVCAWKWRRLGVSLGFSRPFAFYWVAYFGATFPSLFLPTALGGDVFRVVALCRGGGDRLKATVSVLADRGTGFLPMVWIAAAACALGVDGGRLPAAAVGAIYGLAGALTLGFFGLFPLAPAAARRWGVETLIGRALALWRDPGTLLLALLIGAAFQVACCAMFYLMGRALGLPVPPAFWALVAPLSAIASMSPVTINGLGERTAVTILLLGYAGIPTEQAIAFSLAWTAVGALAAVMGGLVLLLAGGWANAAEPQPTPA